MDAGSRNIRSVLLSLPHWGDRDLQRLGEAFAPADVVAVHPGDAGAIEVALQRVDVAVIPLDLDERFLHAPQLRWVHCDHAGLSKSARPEIFERGLIVTGSAGRSAEALAQHGFYFALGLTFGAHDLFEDQRAHSWRRDPRTDGRLALWGKTLGIIGLGHTGRAMAALGKAFGMRVVASRRRATREAVGSVDVLLSTDAGDPIDQLIDESDVIMLAAPLTNETYHLIAGNEFARMKRGAFLINMARGPLVDQKALIEALQSGQIAGAGLDVTDPEPLPAGSPLWDMPNVMITPHSTPRLPDRTDRSLAIIVENIRRYRAGEPMLNAITPRDIFSVPGGDSVADPHWGFRS